MKILLTQESAPARFAAEELAKYSFLMMGGRLAEITYRPTAKEDEAGTIRLGLLADFSLDTGDVADPLIEDVIDICVKNGTGYIAGSNPRSILMGVYRYLRSAGCMWVRPGVEGEYIPKRDISAHSFTYRKRADHPFRGECSEGAISYESLRDMIYWLPKVGMNMLMNEGNAPYIYMNRWYMHKYNTHLHEKNAEESYEKMLEYVDRCEYDFQRTGVSYHIMGHAWMFSELGIVNGHTHNTGVDIKEEDRQYLALTAKEGVRGISSNSMFFTNFCYSNPAARKKLVDFWVKFAKEKPYVDYFHVWLADSKTSACVCEECVKEEFSDWYVLLLNEIDEALTAAGIQARFVFIMYVYTHRPPKKLKIKNPDRFMLLYACGINYDEGYSPALHTGKIPPYDPAVAHIPTQPLGNLWRREWKRISGARLSCVYEYRFYINHYSDPGYMQVAREVHRDMRLLSALDFQGTMSDQTMRNFLPTGLPMAIMAETLFDTSTDFEAFTATYFEKAFGKDGEKCREYLEALSEHFCPRLVRNDGRIVTADEEGFTVENEGDKEYWYDNPAAAEKFAAIPAIVDAFLPTITENRRCSNICQAKSWDYLRYHAHIAKELSAVYLAGALGDMDKARALYLTLVDWISLHELEISPVFDLCLFEGHMRRKLKIQTLGDVY